MGIFDNKLNIVKTGLSVLFLLCLLDWQYGFYQLVRFLGMIGFGILAFDEYENDRSWFVVLDAKHCGYARSIYIRITKPHLIP